MLISFVNIFFTRRKTSTSLFNMSAEISFVSKHEIIWNEKHCVKHVSRSFCMSMFVPSLQHPFADAGISYMCGFPRCVFFKTLHHELELTQGQF